MIDIAKIENKILSCLHRCANLNNIHALIIGSSWATGEISRLLVADDEKLISDIDLHIILTKKYPELQNRMSTCFKREIPEVVIDANIFHRKNLGRLKPTFEAVITGMRGKVIYGNEKALSGFPRPDQISPMETWRILLNRITELLYGFVVNKSNELKYPKGYLSIKAMADIAFVIIHKHGSFYATYKERLSYLKQIKGRKIQNKNEALLIETAIKGIMMKLTPIQSMNEEVLFLQAQKALLAALRYMGLDFKNIYKYIQSLRIYGPAWKGWARLFLNPTINLKYSLPRNISMWQKEPRSQLYSIFIHYFSESQIKNGKLTFNTGLNDELFQHFPVKIAPSFYRQAPSKNSFLFHCFALFMADVYKKGKYPYEK